MKWTHTGKLTTKVLVIIPFILYLSRSIIESDKRKTRNGIVYGLHITPFITVGINWSKKNE